VLAKQGIAGIDFAPEETLFDAILDAAVFIMEIFQVDRRSGLEGIRGAAQQLVIAVIAVGALAVKKQCVGDVPAAEKADPVAGVFPVGGNDGKVFAFTGPVDLEGVSRLEFRS